MSRPPWHVRCRGLATITFVLVTASVAAAGDADPELAASPQVAAEEVVRVVAAGDDAALKQLAQRTPPDPWEVCDELLGRSALAAAGQFAGYVPSPDAPALRAFLERAAGDQAPRRAAFARARQTEASDAVAVLAAQAASSNHLLESRIALFLGEVDLDGGEPESAAARFRTAAELARTVGWRDGEIVALEALRDACDATGDWLALRDAVARVLQIHEARGEATPALVLARTNLAGAESQIENRLHARTLFRQALNECRAVGARDLEAFVRSGYALCILKLGAYAEALSEAEAAGAWARAEEDADSYAYAISVQAAVLGDLGDHERALQLTDRLLGLLDPDSGHAADAQANAGISLAALDRFEEALKRFDGALGTYRANGNRRHEALLLVNRGQFVHMRRGAWALASSDFHAALERSPEDLVVSSLAALRLADVAAARLAARSAEADVTRGAWRVIARSYAGFRHRAQSVFLREAWRAVARTYAEVRRRARSVALRDLEFRATVGRAHALFRAGDKKDLATPIETAYGLLLGLTEGLSDERVAATRAAEDRSRLFPLSVRVALLLEQDATLIRFLELGRAAALLDALGGRDRLQGVGLSRELLGLERAARGRLVAAHAAYRLIRARSPGRKATSEWNAIHDAEGALNAVTVRIRREAKRVAGLTHPEPASMDELQSTLGASRALVYYTLLRDASSAVVLSKRGVRTHELESEAHLRALVGALHDAFADDDRPAYDKTLDELRKALHIPTIVPPGVRTVLVCPDGPLAHLPWQHLFATAGAPQVAAVPSGTTWRMLMRERERSGEGLLALGDPVYEQTIDGVRARMLGRTRPLARLVHSGAEVRAITEPGDVVLLRERATREGLLGILPSRERWSAVHFGCHGILHPRIAGLSALALTPTPEDDGFLRAMDVLRLSIPADLVVLGACDVGRGKLARGEGLLGLTRAFLAAGASRVIASIHPVDDKATKRLMEELHAQWRRGASACEALRRAQERVAAEPKWAAPTYWASWTVWGLPD